MSSCFLGDQTRPAKPRRSGLTAIIDPGLPLGAFADIIQSHHAWIDAVKFGWGSALVTARVGEKIAFLKRHCIPFWFGGTLFERAYVEGRVEEFIDFVGRHGAPYVDISDGTINLPLREKLRLIRHLSDDFLVLSEIGKKDSDIEPDADAWTHAIWSELEVGASLGHLGGKGERHRRSLSPVGRGTHRARRGAAPHESGTGRHFLRSAEKRAPGAFHQDSRRRRQPVEHRGSGCDRPGNAAARFTQRHLSRPSGPSVDRTSGSGVTDEHLPSRNSHA